MLSLLTGHPAVLHDHTETPAEEGVPGIFPCTLSRTGSSIHRAFGSGFPLAMQKGLFQLRLGLGSSWSLQGRRLVAAQPENPLQTQGTGSVLLTRYPPDCPEPQNQRLACPLEDRSRDHRSFVSAAPTFQQPALQRPSFSMVTRWTTKTLWPAQPAQVLAACIFGRETSLKVHQVLRVLLHTGEYNILGLVQRRRYP